jgi:hypothetical protein
VSCPICESEETAELVVDLLLCSSCNHIFKREPFEWGEINIYELHKYIDPVRELREVCSLLHSGDRLKFVFPSMMFSKLEICPNDFYVDKYNHYFNQMSLMTLLDRCGLKVIWQTNVVSNNWCETTVETVKE